MSRTWATWSMTPKSTLCYVAVIDQIAAVTVHRVSVSTNYYLITASVELMCTLHVLACDVFVRTNRRAIATMFVPRLAVCLWRACVVIALWHFNVDLCLWLDSPMFWAPWHQNMCACSQPSFSSSTWKIGRVRMCKLGVISQERLKIEVKLLLRKSYMLRRFAQQRMTLSDLEWPYHASRAISAVAELLVKPRIHSVMWAAFDECTTVSFVGTRGS